MTKATPNLKFDTENEEQERGKQKWKPSAKLKEEALTTIVQKAEGEQPSKETGLVSGSYKSKTKKIKDLDKDPTCVGTT